MRESERSISAIGEFCAANGIQCDYRLDGTLYTATNQAQVGGTDAVIAALEQKGSIRSSACRWNRYNVWQALSVIWKAGTHRPPPRCSPAAWCVACAGSRYNGVCGFTKAPP